MTLPEALQVLEIDDIENTDVNRSYADKYNELKTRLDNAFDNEIRKELEEQINQLEEAKAIVGSLPSTEPLPGDIHTGGNEAALGMLGLKVHSTNKEITKAYKRKVSELLAIRDHINTPAGKQKINEQLQDLENAYLTLIGGNTGSINRVKAEKNAVSSWLIYLCGILAIGIIGYLLYSQRELNQTIESLNAEKHAIETEKNKEINILEHELSVFNNGFLAIKNGTNKSIDIINFTVTYKNKDGEIQKHEKFHEKPFLIKSGGTYNFRQGVETDTIIWDGEVITYSINFKFNGKSHNFSGLWSTDNENGFILINFE